MNFITIKKMRVGYLSKDKAYSKLPVTDQLLKTVFFAWGDATPRNVTIESRQTGGRVRNGPLLVSSPEPI
jgi:hypothetical protein